MSVKELWGMMFTPAALLRTEKMSLRLVFRVKLRSIPSMDRGLSCRAREVSALAFWVSMSSSVSSAARASSLPDVPTIAEEAKIPGFDITLWVGFFAPKGTPTQIIERLNTDINAILATPEVKERFKAEGAEIHLLSVPETAAFTKAESEKYSKLIKELNITLN